MLCALATLRVQNLTTLSTYCDRIAGSLHAFTPADAAKCLWAFCALGLKQAPAYTRMMRTLEKQLQALKADDLCQLIRAIVPLGRAAACARLVPRLCARLATTRPFPAFKELLPVARDLSQRVPLPEALLLELHNSVVRELSATNDNDDDDDWSATASLAGSLEPAQICTSLWLFVRHLPYYQQHAPASPLLNTLPPLIQRLVALVVDTSSLSSDQLCDVLEAVRRLGRHYAQGILSRLVQQVELRLQAGKLRPGQMMQAAWAVTELGNPAAPPPLAERLASNALDRVRMDAAALCDVLRAVSVLPMRWPLLLLERLVGEVCSVREFNADQLTDVLDALARMRYDAPNVLGALEVHVEAVCARGQMHEAQAACIVESLATLGFTGRGAHLVPSVLQKLQQSSALLPHTAASLLHGLALLRFVPPGFGATEARARAPRLPPPTRLAHPLPVASADRGAYARERLAGRAGRARVAAALLRRAGLREGRPPTPRTALLRSPPPPPPPHARARREPSGPASPAAGGAERARDGHGRGPRRAGGHRRPHHAVQRHVGAAGAACARARALAPARRRAAEGGARRAHPVAGPPPPCAQLPPRRAAAEC